MFCTVSSTGRRPLTTRVTVLASRIDTLTTRAFVVIALAIASISDAHAQAGAGADPSTILQNISDFILGPFGKSLAVLGIIAIGVSWMFGRASLGLIAGVIGGIVIMFGASFIGKKLTGAA